MRLEQLYPFPRAALTQELTRFPQAEIVWCQEEPWNMGAWTYLDRRLENVLIELGGACNRPVYAGRPEAASPATGSHRRHVREQEALVDQALTIQARGAARRQAAE